MEEGNGEHAMRNADDAQKLLETAITRLREAPERAADGRILFPNGIDQLRMVVQVGADNAPLVKLELDAKGPKAVASAFEGEVHTLQLKKGLWQILKLSVDTEVGLLWVNADQTEEHWFYDQGVFALGESVRMIKQSDYPTLDTVKNSACAKGYYYIRAVLDAPVPPTGYGSCAL